MFWIIFLNIIYKTRNIFIIIRRIDIEVKVIHACFNNTEIHFNDK